MGTIGATISSRRGKHGSQNRFELSLQFNTWTGGGPFIDARVIVQAVLNSVSVLH